MSVASRAARRAVVATIEGYRMLLSPWLPRACRFVPTCSEYASDAVRSHGVIGGLGRALHRLMRCHPLHPGGVDLVD